MHVDPPRPWKVRPLEWHDCGCGVWAAVGLGLTLFQVSQEAERLYLLESFGGEPDDMADEEHPSLDAAQAAAQRRFEARVSACLQPADPFTPTEEPRP